MTFPDVQLQVDNFKLDRMDYTQRSGGLLTYVRGDIIQRARTDVEIDYEENGRIVFCYRHMVCTCFVFPLCVQYTMY